MELLDLCETVKGNARAIAVQIVSRWREIADAEPWLALPPELDFDHLPELIRALAAAALCTEYERGLCRAAAGLAAEHGATRAEQGFGENLIHREYHLLRRALAERMKRDHGENATVYYATMRLDALVSVVAAAALYGFNRSAIDDARWPDILDDLLDDWPLPTS